MEEEPIVFVADVEVKHVALARYELAEQGIPYDSRMDGLVKYASFEDRRYPEYFLPFIAARIKNMCDRDFELTSGCISAVGKITLKPGMTVQAIGLQTLSRPEDTGSRTVHAGEEVKQILTPKFSLGVIRAINEGTLDGFEMELDHNKMTMPISDFPEMIEYCKNIVGEDYDKLRENIDKYSK